MNDKDSYSHELRVIRGAYRPLGVAWRPFVVEKTGSTNRLWRGSGPSGEWLLKWYSYPQAGIHPESEISQFFKGQNFGGVAEFGARLDSKRPEGWTTIAFIQRWLEGHSVWEKTVEAMRSGRLEQMFASDLGRCVGRLHQALGSGSRGTVFSADSWGIESQKAWTERISASLDRLQSACGGECPSGMEKRQWTEAKRLCLGTTDQAKRRIAELSELKVDGDIIRIHGDLHLGQILEVDGKLTQERFVVVDFEGEPMRSIEERRIKDLPLRDVAGMFRSFAYAAAVAGVPSQIAESWNAQFLEGWGEYMPMPAGDWRRLLAGLIWEKAIYEAEYELRHRPEWLWIPLRVLSEEL